jgi:pimeloyl-ACP methyl ester carboxylesterase/DNA-binding CsgD family transcriptional regulator
VPSSPRHDRVLRLAGRRHVHRLEVRQVAANGHALPSRSCYDIAGSRALVMQQDIRFCRTADGVRLAYAVSGDGPPLVMSATWLTHLEQQWRSLAWRPWLDIFTRDHKVLRHDSRGCGLSDRDAGNLSYETWVRDLECVTEAAGFRRFAMVGTCWGGAIAIDYAARHPERVSHLVLYGSYARGRLRQTNSPNEIAKAPLLAELTRLGWGREDHDFVQVWGSRFQPGGTRNHLLSWSEQMRAATCAETAVRLLQIGWHIDVREAARKIKCPVLIVHPERDVVSPIEEGRLLASLIPNARFVPLDSENHMLLADEPAWARFYAAVRDFLAEPGYAAPRRNALRLEELTPRERSVLEGIAAGLGNAEIGRSLRLSEKTVRNHITRIFDKISVKHRYQAIVLAREAGLGGAESPPGPGDTGHLSQPRAVGRAPRRGGGLNTIALARRRVSSGRASRAPAREPR